MKIYECSALNSEFQYNNLIEKGVIPILDTEYVDIQMFTTSSTSMVIQSGNIWYDVQHLAVNEISWGLINFYMLHVVQNIKCNEPISLAGKTFISIN